MTMTMLQTISIQYRKFNRHLTYGNKLDSNFFLQPNYILDLFYHELLTLRFSVFLPFRIYYHLFFLCISVAPNFFIKLQGEKCTTTFIFIFYNSKSFPWFISNTFFSSIKISSSVLRLPSYLEEQSSLYTLDNDKFFHFIYTNDNRTFYTYTYRDV